MTEKEVRDRLRQRFTDGKGRCVVKGTEYIRCAYRNSDRTNACAIGCLILDEYCTDELENTVTTTLVVNRGGMWDADDTQTHLLAEALNKSGVPASTEMLRILKRAQEMHDKRSNWKGNQYIGSLDFLGVE